MDIFEQKSISPMLIGAEGPAFDSEDYIHELKLDGVRCLAYIDRNYLELRNKRNLRVAHIYPELSEIHRQVKHRCILDGELIVMRNGAPYFAEMQRRALMSDAFKIRLAAAKLPVSFTAFDILYDKDRPVNELPLMERKALLAATVMESDRLAVSRYIEEKGSTLYTLAEQNNLEGIVSKRKDSLYYFGKRTRDWIKAKNLKDDDFVICGYIRKEKGVVSLVLGQYGEGSLRYKGHVTLGVGGRDFERISNAPVSQTPPFDDIPGGHEQAVWLEPDLVGTVKYMEKTAAGSLRQPVFKGLRDDKAPKDCEG